jgi:hypothetical protein
VARIVLEVEIGKSQNTKSPGNAWAFVKKIGPHQTDLFIISTRPTQTEVLDWLALTLPLQLVG